MSTLGQSVSADVHPSVAGNTPVGSSFWPVEPTAAAPTVAGVGFVSDVDADASVARHEESDLVKDARKIFGDSFVWLMFAAETSLTRLQAELSKEDSPTMSESLLLGVLRIAIAGATGSASEHLASLISKAGPLKELVKSSLRSGVNEGVAAAAGALSGASKADSIRAFIDTHREGLHRAYSEAQTKWTTVGSKSLRTDEDARILIEACEPSRVQEAGKRQYEICRDAWLAYIAQSKFGEVPSTAIDENGNPVTTGGSTDMTSSDVREARNRDLPGRYRTEEGPDEIAAFFGVADGVLTAVADLPDIKDVGGGLHGMDGRPRIRTAYLNGVNETIRKQFIGKPLIEAKVPRVIVCHTEGSHEDFEIRINEAGIKFGRVPSSWLVSRALTEPGNLGKDEATLKEIGTERLLQELVPTSFQRGTSE